MGKCNRCGHSLTFPTFTEDFTVLGIPYRYSSNSYLEDNLDPYYHLLLEKLLTIKAVDYKSFAVQIRHDESIVCDKCNEKQNYRIYISIADEFYFYISRYIGTLLESISLKNFDLSLADFGYEYSDIYQKLASALPLRYNKEKRVIRKLLEVQNELPIIGGKGGEEEVLKWIIENVLSDTFSLVFAAIVGYGIKIGNTLLRKRRIKKIIREAIRCENYSLKELSMDEIKDYLEIPNTFTGSKEELIEKVVYGKALEYKNTIIEKMRISKK